MKLNYREYGSYTEEKPSLVFLHGLFGSSSNWHSIARQLESDFHILVVDLRNHGRSPHSQHVGYPEMADDLFKLVDDHGLDQVVLIGHSMGGKVAMWFALHHSELVARLVVVDIAPVSYEHDFDLILEALHSINLAQLSSRSEADSALANFVDEPGLRQYLLQNLSRHEGGWRWRINLSGLEAGIDYLVGYPPIPPGATYSGDTLFIHGGLSHYVTKQYEKSIKALFPQAEWHEISAAGHWVYAEKPDAFLAALRSFLP